MENRRAAHPVSVQMTFRVRNNEAGTQIQIINFDWERLSFLTAAERQEVERDIQEITHSAMHGNVRDTEFGEIKTIRYESTLPFTKKTRPDGTGASTSNSTN